MRKVKPGSYVDNLQKENESLKSTIVMLGMQVMRLEEEMNARIEHIKEILKKALENE